MTSPGGEPPPQGDAETARTAQHRRATVVLSAVVAIALMAAVIAGLELHHSSSPSAGSTVTNRPTGSSAPSTVGARADPVLRELSNIPAAVAAQVGSGSSTVLMKPISGEPLTTAGKPTVLFVGALFCPFCAAERWAIVAALSRFGTFSGVSEIRSAEDGFATFDLSAATYSSKYVAFAPVEIEGQNEQPLDKLTGVQRRIFGKYAHNSFPFLYLDGKFAQVGAGYTPLVLEGLDHAQIAAQLTNPSSPATKGIVGEANVLTAAICTTTDEQPSQVCSTPEVAALQPKLSGTVSG